MVFNSLLYTNISPTFGSAKAQKCEITACLPVRKQVRTLVQMKPMPLATMLGCLPRALCTDPDPGSRWPPLGSLHGPYPGSVHLGATQGLGNSSQGTEAAEQPRPRGTALPDLGGGELQGRSPKAALVLQASAVQEIGRQALGVGQLGSDLSCETSGK